MRVVVADKSLGSLVEDARAGVAALGQLAYDSMTLVLDLIALPTVTLAAIDTLTSLSLGYDSDNATHVVITTAHVRMTFRSIAYPSGEPIMFDSTTHQTPHTLQLLEAVATDEANSRRKGSARA